MCICYSYIFLGCGFIRTQRSVYRTHFIPINTFRWSERRIEAKSFKHNIDIQTYLIFYIALPLNSSVLAHCDNILLNNLQKTSFILASLVLFTRPNIRVFQQSKQNVATENRDKVGTRCWYRLQISDRPQVPIHHAMHSTYYVPPNISII